MSIPTTLFPLFVQVVLTFVLLIRVTFLRHADLKNGVIKPADIASRELNQPQHTQRNLLREQFEIPVLFYVLTILEIVTRRRADFTFVLLAWVFVGSRIVHAYIDTTSNIIIKRGNIFNIGVVVLIIMWIIYMIRILFGLP